MNVALYRTERLSKCAALFHVAALLAARNVLAARLRVLAIRMRRSRFKLSLFFSCGDLVELMA
jgi:hypothetical protein